LKTNEKRWSYAANFPEVILNPDEIWNQRDNGLLVRWYIKYYSEDAYGVIAGDSGNTFKAEK
jgi:hypothetical protein